MSEDNTTFDDILDQLAQGETYAARDDISLDDVRDDLTDGGPEGSRSSRRSLAGTRLLSPRVEAYGGEQVAVTGRARMMIVPRPAAIVRVFSLAVVVMMALMTALAAIIAQSVLELTGEMRNDERLNLLADVREVPVDPAVLMSDEAFAALCERWPDRRQQLLLKRFRAFAEVEAWIPAIAAFERARLEDAVAVPAGDRLLFCRVLLASREFERAGRELAAIPVAELDEAQRGHLAGLTTRLQLAEMDRDPRAARER